jgi:hypothetical protein
MEKHIKIIFLFQLFPCLLILTLFSVAQADKVPTLEDIEFYSPSADEERITFKLNGTYIPKIFAIKGKKPRVVFDFPNTITARTLNNIITTNGNFIKQIRIGIHEGEVPKTRVVLDLIPDKEIDFNQNFDQQKNALTVTVYYAGTTPARPTVNKTKPTTTKPKLPEVQEPAPSKETALPLTAVRKPEPQPEPAVQPPSPFMPPDFLTTPEPPAPVKKHAAEIPKTETEDLLPVVSNEPPILHSVRFDDSSSRGEMIQFMLNDFYPPIVFGIEEGLPRVVCDFKNTRIEASVKKTIKTHGRYVKNIRIGQHKNPDKIRVVIDLEPNNNYDLQQVFFKEDNLFVIIVNIMHNTPPVTELEKPLTQ